METESSFVWSQSRVELHPVAPVDLYFSLVVLPDHSELYHAFRNRGNLQSFLVFRIFLEERGILESRHELYIIPLSVTINTQDRSIRMGRTFVRLLELWLRWKVRHGCYLACRMVELMEAGGLS